MSYNFPANPVEDQEYIPPVGGQTYVYKAPRWLVKGVPPSGEGGGAGIDEAPVDGKQYGRQGADWTEVVANPDWATLAGKPVTFAPTLPIPWADVSDKPSTFPPTVPIAWTDVSGKPATYPPTVPIAWANITGQPATYPPTVPIAWTNISGKPSTFPPVVPIAWTDVSGKPATFPPTLPISWANITGQPTTYPPTVPIAWTDITGQPASYPPILPISIGDVTNLGPTLADMNTAITGKLDTAAYTAADVLTKVKTVDGTGSGLDADLLDGQTGTYYSDYANLANKPVTFPPLLPIAQTGVTNLTSDLAAKEPVITSGTTQQYWRGDKTWQALPPPGVTEAPIDGQIYGRKNAGWEAGGGYLPSGVIVADAAPANPMLGQLWFESDTGNTYIWYADANSSQWIHVSGFSAYSFGAGGGIAEAPVDGNSYARRDTQWVNMGGDIPVPEAPLDGKQYVRKDGAWIELVIPPPPATPFMFDVNGDAIVKFSATIAVRIKPTGLILTKDDIEVFSVSV